MKRFLFLCAIFMFTNTYAGVLYRYIDSNGRVLYSDKPVQDAERLKLGKEPAVEEVLSYETQKAKQYFPVTLFTFEECGKPCSDAKLLLKTRGIPFTEKNLTTTEDLEEYRKASGTGKAPAMSLGKIWLKGFQAEQWHKELDFAGYPKTAPYRPKPATAK